MSPLRVSPFTRGLAAFALAVAVGGNALLAALGEPSAATELGRFLTGVQGVDSWRPMNQAHAHLAHEAAGPLYEWLFFEQRIKFIYPPTALLGIDGLRAVLPDGALQGALNVLSWLALLATAGLAAALLDRTGEASPRTRAAGGPDRALRAALALALALTFYPVLKAYTLGQMQTFVNAAFAGFLLCLVAGRPAAAGVLVAVMAAVKPQYAVLGLWGLLRGERRLVLGALAAGVVLLGLSLWRFGLAAHLDYLSVLGHVSRLGEAYWPNQTLNGFLNRLLGNGVAAHWDPHVYPPYHPVVHVGTLVGAAVVLGAALFAPVGERARGGWSDAGAVALGLTIAAPVAWEHHYGVLLPLFAVWAPALAAERPLPRGSLAALAAAFAVSGQAFHARGRLSGGPWNPLQSLLLLVALGCFVGLLARRAGPRPDRRDSAAGGGVTAR